MYYHYNDDVTVLFSICFKYSHLQFHEKGRLVCNDESKIWQVLQFYSQIRDND